MLKRAASIVLGVVVMACSGTTNNAGDAGGGGDGGGISAQQACQDQAHARCTRLQSCAPGRLQIQYGDEGTCEQRYVANCTTALSAPSNGNTPALTEGCAQAFAGWACNDYLDNANTPAACAQATGTVAAGAACSFAGQCQSGFCAIPPTAACGVCAAPPAAGDSCAQLSTCGQGLICTSDTQTCVVYAAQGATCGKGAPCGASLYCVGSQPANNVTGTCQPVVAQSGASCDPTGQTSAGCDRNQGLVCNTMTKQCAAATIAAGGQPCGTNDVNSQTAYCSGNGVCSSTAANMPGTCIASAADGAACDTANGPGCMLLARCVVSGSGTAGTCQLATATCM